MSYILQSVLLNRNRFTLSQAVKYMEIHNLKVKKVDETEHFYRFRQVAPSTLMKQGYNKMRTKVIVPGEVEFIFAYK